MVTYQMWLIRVVFVLASVAAVKSEGLSTAPHILPRRSLLNSVAPVTVVTTAEQLDTAIRNGDTRIEIQNHLDFSSWVLPRTLHSTASITGNCATPPPAGTALPLETLVTGRCVVVVSSSFARVTGALWIDGLHLVLVEQPNDEGARLELCADGLSVCEIQREGTGDASLLEVTGGQARLWVTNVAMQGTTSGTGSNGHPSQAYKFLASALEVASGGRVYMEDSVINDFETVRAVSMSGGGFAALKRVSFNDNTLIPSFRGSGLVIVTVTDGQGDSRISLEQITYSGNSEDHPELVADANVTYYGDDTAPLMCTYPAFDDSIDYTLTCQLTRSLPISDAGTAAGFLTGSDEWLVRAQQGDPLPSGVPELEVPSSGRNGTFWDRNFIIFVATSSFVLLLVVIGSVVCCVWPWWSCARYQPKPLSDIRTLFKKKPAKSSKEEHKRKDAEEAEDSDADALKATPVEEAVVVEEASPEKKAAKAAKKRNAKEARRAARKAGKEAEGAQKPMQEPSQVSTQVSTLGASSNEVSAITAPAGESLFAIQSALAGEASRTVAGESSFAASASMAEPPAVGSTFSGFVPAAPGAGQAAGGSSFAVPGPEASGVSLAVSAASVGAGELMLDDQISSVLDMKPPSALGPGFR